MIDSMDIVSRVVPIGHLMNCTVFRSCVMYILCVISREYKYIDPYTWIVIMKVSFILQIELVIC